MISLNKDTLARFLKINSDIFSKKKKGRNARKLIFVEAISIDPFIVFTTMKISAAISERQDMDFVVLPAMRADSSIRQIISSFFPARILNFTMLLVRGFLLNIIKILVILFKISDGAMLSRLSDGNIPVGIHIYDAILRRQGLPYLEKLSFRQRLLVIFEMSFYYSMKRLFRNTDYAFAVLPDNTYREGLVYELVKAKSIPSIVGIDMNGISMHKYSTHDDYAHHCRKPDDDVVAQIMEMPALFNLVEEYLSFRFSGKEQQHDLLRAYAQDKGHLTRSELINAYHLAADKKIVMVMAHIFCDAPHGTPGMLFQDYRDWLIKTCERLSLNHHINFLVKEHPSVSLYKEENVIDFILEQHGFQDRLVSKSINTKSLFDSVDVVITCGGTAGMEFPCFGVPVVVAAQPPYADLPYIIQPHTAAGYYAEIDKIHFLQRLSDHDIKMAKAVLYTIQKAMKVPKQLIGLGSQNFFMGNSFNYDLFFEEMIEDCRHGDGYRNLLRFIDNLLRGSHRNLINYEHLDNQLIDAKDAFTVHMKSMPDKGRINISNA